MSERQAVFIYEDTHNRVKVTRRHVGNRTAKQLDKLLLEALEHAQYELKNRMAR